MFFNYFHFMATSGARSIELFINLQIAFYVLTFNMWNDFFFDKILFCYVKSNKLDFDFHNICRNGYYKDLQMYL